jgi:flagellar hook-length control protein FliK
VKAAAPQALLPQNVAKGKKAGRTGRAAGLVAATEKGAGKFLKLVNAMAAVKDGRAVRPSGDHPLKKGLGPAVAVKAAQPVLPQQVAAKGPQLPVQQLPAEKDEQAEARKKTARMHAAPSALTAQPAVHIDQPRHLFPAPAGKGTSAETPGVVASTAHAPARKAEPIVRVIDLRRKHQSTNSTEETANQHKPVTQAGTEKDLTSAFTQKLAAAHDVRPESLPKASGSPTAHQQTPMERLKEMAGSELVKATNVIVRDGGGEIRLVLKPESLGSVRIRMNVVDKLIEGRIIVDNPAVKQVVEGNIDALRTALAAEGFQTGALSVSVGQQNADNQRQQAGEPAALRRLAASSFERSVPVVENVSMGDLLVNLFV